MILRYLNIIWSFYRKLLIPALIITLVASIFLKPVTGEFNFSVNFIQVGLSFLFVSLIMQLIIYELRNPDEYYFYYNLGLGKKQLWVANAVIGIIVCVIFILIHTIL